MKLLLHLLIEYTTCMYRGIINQDITQTNYLQGHVILFTMLSLYNHYYTLHIMNLMANTMHIYQVCELVADLQSPVSRRNQQSVSLW